ncbi:SpoVR family protein [Lamprobacter modestohalophilus]|uniref:SpoVR family protein n=1 Tax=Lamprobacter modestohalophilus TaxID=1064514 RepID=UPI002ADED06B|nr:SpoVR family protein [Lamprobacter modestohalophilus]MCF8005465.1 SpoVR family protein [Chromatiaceae bacterium]MEA1049789.1 SpoVR family protein [Lamprobacter modestohalophilus]
MASNRIISDSSEWTFPLLKRFDQEIARVATDEFGLDTYANQVEVISSEQMIDAYSSVGLPINYHHWSYGKQFVATEQTYRRGQMGLAYEIVINSDPCIAYLMEENTLPMQALVIAHACYGHNSFFKGNYLFRTWTSADAIIDYLVFARNYIAECEERYGTEQVELLLDSCHALMNYGVDRYRRPSPLSMAEEKRRQAERENYLQSQVNDLWRTLPVIDKEEGQLDERRFPAEPQENLLYFIEKNAPLLEPWQREIVRIVRRVAQYFYPQRQTQVMNEGWATFWHYTLLNRLYDQGMVGDGFMMEVLQSHTNVVYQPSFDSPYYSGINPYALGFAMMRDIRRICEAPTDEDRYWFPDMAGQDWLKTLDFAMRNFKDESFIAQFLSPHLMREFRMFAVSDDDREDTLEITAIHEETGYRQLRQRLADQYNLGSREPNIQVYNVDVRGDRSLTLRHFRYNRRPLGDSLDEMLKHIHRLWGFDVRMEAVDEHGRVQLVGET